MLVKYIPVVIMLSFFTLLDAQKIDTSPPSPSSAREDTSLLGMDVSSDQGKIDWEQVKQDEAKIAFVFVKATEGTSHIDPRFKKNWQGARQAGLFRGACHRFDAKQDAKTQALFFIHTVEKLEELDLPPLLDLESTHFNEVDERAYENFISSVFIWLETVETGLGAKPIIYASPDFARDYLTDIRFNHYTLVPAEYDAVSTAPRMLGAWEGKTWTFWQYSPNGIISGINHRLNLIQFNGSTPELLEFIKSSRQEENVESLAGEPVVQEVKKDNETPTEIEAEPPESRKETTTPTLEEKKEPPRVETTTFNEEINLGKIRFPRNFIHQQIVRKKGIYTVKLISKEHEKTPYFQVFDKENHLLLEEMALVIPRKIKHGNFNYRIRTRLMGNEYFMIRVTQPDRYIYAFFFIAK